MKKSRLREEQIAFALRQANGGTPVGDVCGQLAPRSGGSADRLAAFVARHRLALARAEFRSGSAQRIDQSTEER